MIVVEIIVGVFLFVMDGVVIVCIFFFYGLLEDVVVCIFIIVYVCLEG